MAKAPETSAKPVVLPGGLSVPAILMEGDELPPPPTLDTPRREEGRAPVSFAQRSAMWTEPTGQPSPESEPRRLPDAYGTGRLYLTPRDPHCLHAHWDLTAEQQRHHLSLSAHRHFSVRVHYSSAVGGQAAEVHVHPESQSWFLHVDRPGQTYVAELGYYQPDKQWHSLGVSEPATTPVDAPSEDTAARFATLKPWSPAAVELPRPSAAERPLSQAQPEAVPPSRPIAPMSAIEISAASSVLPEFLTADLQSAPIPVEIAAWTEDDEKALEELIGWCLVRQDWPSSAEIAELVQRQHRGPGEEVASAVPMAVEAETIPIPVAGEWEPVSSPPGGELAVAKGFWLNVNAELVVYGATDSSATVSIGGREIRLRPDGTFSCRFALPDGAHSLPVVAAAPHGDIRSAELKFHRLTAFSGAVGIQPQDPALQPPGPEDAG